MYTTRNSWLILLGILSILGFACKKMIDPAFTNTHYPADIEEIFVNKCATAGCHNDKSYQNAANLNMSSWESLLQGGVSGSVVIPFSVNQSSLLQFINTYDDLGIRSSPTMPINGQALSREEVIRVKTWIAEGCPSRNGEIPFASNPTTRAKAYITNQGCDLVSVVDAETRLVMRYVSVGHDPNQIELPHRIAVSPDGKYWYLCFTNGSYVQKFDAHYDTLVSEVFIGPAMWNIIVTSSDGKKAFVSDLSSNGKLVELDLMNMTVSKTLQGSGLFTFPHGLAYSQTHDTIYSTAQYGNMIYRIIPSVPQVDKISLVKGALPITTPQLQDPHEVLMSPDYSKYFVTCRSSNELRVMAAGVDTLLKVIPMGIHPLTFDYSKKRNLLFITNQEDPNPVYPMFKGSVYVVDMNTLTVVRKIYEKFYQPHGIGVDDKKDLLYVASRNADATGPAPHHISECEGRNGFFHVIDLNTWQVVKSASEVSVDSYSLGVRE